MLDDMLLVLTVQSIFFEMNPGFTFIESDYKTPEKTAEIIKTLIKDPESEDINNLMGRQNDIKLSQIDIFKNALIKRGLAGIEGFKRIEERLKNLPSNRNPATSFFDKDIAMLKDKFF